ncbi:MAG: 5-(carboxyamino)imidazole ribonucleotide synthase [Candidatus Xenobia bacterium]
MRRVGILGGGQLGAMLLESLYELGAEAVVYDPDAEAPAARRVRNAICAPWDDRDALRKFYSQCDIATYEFENVPADAVRGAPVPVLPGPGVLDVTQHRVREKSFCQSHGLPHVRFEPVTSRAELPQAVARFGTPALLKTARGGYDGHGQFRLAGGELPAVDDGVLEELLELDLEVSCIVARPQHGEEVVFPVFENEHRNHILDFTTVPATVPPAVAREVQRLARQAARDLDVRGLLTTEFFLTRRAPVRSSGLQAEGWHIYVNEFAPRPHNSGHVTRVACAMSQFDALARILLDVPLQEPELLGPAFCMGNLLGEVWSGSELSLESWREFPEVREVVLYGKTRVAPRRKMGHFTVAAATPDAARERAVAFRRSLQVPIP